MRLPIFFITFVLFVGILALKRRRQERKQQDLNESFLDRERRANMTRKQDISNLNFLKFSLDALPDERYPDETLLMLETDLIGYHDAKIINLSRYSNTDLKLMYGAANFNQLCLYDNNYHTLANTLLVYAKRHQELGHVKEAIHVLEYAVSLRMELGQVYLLLAQLYQEQGAPEKIEELKQALSTMDEDFLSHTLPKL